MGLADSSGACLEFSQAGPLCQFQAVDPTGLFSFVLWYWRLNPVLVCAHQVLYHWATIQSDSTALCIQDSAELGQPSTFREACPSSQFSTSFSLFSKYPSPHGRCQMWGRTEGPSDQTAFFHTSIALVLQLLPPLCPLIILWWMQSPLCLWDSGSLGAKAASVIL